MLTQKEAQTLANTAHRVAVLGSTGYAGQEFLRLARGHAKLQIAALGVRDDDAQPARGAGTASACSLRDLEVLVAAGACDTLVSCLPHGIWKDIARRHPALTAAPQIIDLSSDYRDGADGYVYGLPEAFRAHVASAQRVANPGCYATGVILAVRPLAEAGLLASGSQVIADCKSGATGAGKELRRDLHFSELDENFKAYNLFSHRHTPEIAEQTGLPESQLIFSTHLLPIARGILSTIYVTLAEPQSLDAIEALYRKAYAGRSMVRIWKAGALPEIQHVAHTNFADIGFTLDHSGQRLIVVSCLDNLGKGAAGQAIQNFNLLSQLEENTGLQ